MVVKEYGGRGYWIGRVNIRVMISMGVRGGTALEREHSVEFEVSMAGMGLAGFLIH